MKWLNAPRIKVAVFAMVAGVLVGGGRTWADFVIGDAVLMGEAINHPSSQGITGGSLSHDGLRFYFSMERDGGYGSFDIWVCERESLDAPWGEAANLGPNINGPASEQGPTISHDELELYFSTGERSGSWTFLSMRSTRASKDEPWGPPTVYNGFYPNDFSSDGLTMYFTDRWSLSGYGESDIWKVTRASTHDDWGDPINLGPNVNSERRQGNACISHDELALFFNEDDSLLMKMSVRRSRDGDWDPPVDISATLCPEHRKRYGPELSPDGRVLYFYHHDSGVFTERKFWQASITPIVDFNGDGKIDGFEVRKMADHWGTDDSVCDIGPMPWGDGIVDAQDLLVLAEHLESPVRIEPPMAHWALDETEGFIAHDGVGTNDGTVMGVPTWRPTDGAVDGALEFNGTTVVVTDHVLSPAQGPFSILLWIKGGAAGQAIISQLQGTNWLMADPATGALMTELRSSGRFARPLSSQTVITDGDWHRVGLSWDGTNRRLYMNDVLVAEDTQDALPDSLGGLLIGCSPAMAPATFWQGLIDDVRIYGRAVQP